MIFLVLFFVGIFAIFHVLFNTKEPTQKPRREQRYVYLRDGTMVPFAEAYLNACRGGEDFYWDLEELKLFTSPEITKAIGDLRFDAGLRNQGLYNKEAAKLITECNKVFEGKV